MPRSRILDPNRSLSTRALQRVPGSRSVSEDGSVTCIACGGPLSFLAYSHPFTFSCPQGHFLTLQALLDVFLPQEQVPEPSALQCWERKAALLRSLAQRALEVGHVFTAADLQDAASRIDYWVATLRRMIPSDDAQAILSA